MKNIIKNIIWVFLNFRGEIFVVFQSFCLIFASLVKWKKVTGFFHRVTIFFRQVTIFSRQVTTFFRQVTTFFRQVLLE